MSFELYFIGIDRGISKLGMLNRVAWLNLGNESVPGTIHVNPLILQQLQGKVFPEVE